MASMSSFRKFRSLFEPHKTCTKRQALRRKLKPLLETLEDRLAPATFTVNTVADTVGDFTTGQDASGNVSLRSALMAANNLGGTNIINFNIGGGGAQTIQPIGQLPPITDAVTIDGSTQPGYSGTPLIELNGINAGASALGLYITAGNCTVRGLAIDQFNNTAIKLTGGGDNVIAGNYIGTDPSGDAGRGNNGHGVFIVDSSGNTIGGTAPGDRNVISGNSPDGIAINGTGATGNLVQGNWIGTTVNGAAAMGNNRAGVTISGGAANNTIGGTTTAARNIISGNNYLGVWITDAGSSNNVIEGNYVGTDVTGETVVPNLAGGIGITAGANGNRIGTDGNGSPAQMQAERNIIAGNNQPSSSGVGIDGGCSNNVVAGNYIGTDATGTQAMPFQFAGISVGGDYNFIGTTAAGVAGATTRNVIASTGYAGINLGGNHNVVAGNFIGTDATGMHANLISGYGIYVDGTSGGGRYNQIGTNGDGVNDAAEGNVIDAAFMDIIVDTAAFNVIAGNLIGTDVTGTVVLAPNSDGIKLDHGAHDNRIGASASDPGHAAEGNVISGHNLAIDSDGGNANIIAGNLIGSDITGLVPLGNTNGTQINDNNDQILNNLMSAASGGELGIGGSWNVVAGNKIGTDITGTVSLGGGVAIGVSIGGSNNTIGGTAQGAGNIICGYARAGVGIFAVGATGNVVEGNYIGTDGTGTKALGNGDGVLIDGASGNTIGGTTAGAGNTIAYNNADGVLLHGGDGNSILGNSIHDNGGLGIESTGGANDNPPGPVLNTFASFTDPTTHVSTLVITGDLLGSARFAPNTTYRIEYFANNSGTGNQGQTYLGFETVTTDGAGNALLVFTVQGPTMAPGEVATATATVVSTNSPPLAANDTSPFSTPTAPVLLLQGPPQTIFTVTTTADSGAGSLRQALLDANANPGADTIQFNIGGGGAQSIAPTSPLPAITDPVTIDAWSQPGFAGTPLIELDGSQAGAADGLEIKSSTATIRGLVIHSFAAGAGVLVAGSGNIVEGCYISTSQFGILMLGAQHNQIGTDGTGTSNPADRNVISGNSFVDVGLDSSNSNQPSAFNVIAGNLIGTDVSGTQSFSNNFAGISFNHGAHDNLIGAKSGGLSDSVDRNVISAHGNFNVVDADSTGSANTVAGNYIGTDITGEISLGDHVGVAFGGDHYLVTQNVISGFTGAAVDLAGSAGVVSGNFIGTDATGKTALPTNVGVHLGGGTNLTIGGTTAAARNIISNCDEGVRITGSSAVSGNVVEGNYIGTDVTGSVAMGNNTGVFIDGGTNNTLGGTTAAARNIIAASVNFQVELGFPGEYTSGNVIEGNYIGTDATGTIGLGGGTAIRIWDVSNNMIGGTVAGAGNLIADNSAGVFVVDAAFGNSILGNSIHDNGGPGIQLVNA
jgi:hypothetical protein